MRRCDGCPARRDTLTYRTKTYRLSQQTRNRLEAIRRARPHEFLDYDELFSELLRFYLNYHRTLQGAVERWLAAKREGLEDVEQQKEEQEPQG